MTLDIPLDQLAAMGDAISAMVMEAKPKVEQDMAGRYREMVLANFGATGPYRASEWAPLSPAYARKVGRKHATLYVTGALYNSIAFEASSDGTRVVASGVRYAAAHQFGYPDRNLPARPYFPMRPDGTPTPDAQSEVELAARESLRRNL